MDFAPKLATLPLYPVFYCCYYGGFCLKEEAPERLVSCFMKVEVVLLLLYLD